jgi:hypothetical protein
LEPERNKEITTAPGQTNIPHSKRCFMVQAVLIFLPSDIVSEIVQWVSRSNQKYEENWNRTDPVISTF